MDYDSRPSQNPQAWWRRLLAYVCILAGPVPSCVFIVALKHDLPSAGDLLFLVLILLVADTSSFEIFCDRWRHAKSLLRHLLVGSLVNYASFLVLFLAWWVFENGFREFDGALMVFLIWIPLLLPLVGIAWLACILYNWDNQPGPLPTTAEGAVARKPGIGVILLATLLLLVLAVSIILGAMVYQSRQLEGYLSQAVHAGTLRDVQAAVAAGADVNHESKIGETPLMWALKRTRPPEIIQALLQAGADVNAVRHFTKETPLLMAAEANVPPATIKALLKAGADINAKDCRNKSALDYARENENQAVIETLIKAGAK